MPWTLTRKQFSICLYLALTTSKSHSQELANVGIDLHIVCFFHGQFYFAISQDNKVRRICILLKPQKARGNQDLMENIMYSESLLPKIIAWKRTKHNHQNINGQKSTKKEKGVKTRVEYSRRALVQLMRSKSCRKKNMSKFITFNGIVGFWFQMEKKRKSECRSGLSHSILMKD